MRTVSIGSVFTTVATLALPAGSYLVYATGNAALQGTGACRIDSESGPLAPDMTVDTGFTIVGSWSFGTAFTAQLECAVSSGTMSVSSGTLYAIQVSGVTLVSSGGGE